MTRRGRWLVGSAAAVVVLLFAGQAAADLLADRWWAAAIGPDQAAFLSGVGLLRLTLGAAAVFLATAWYSGHLLVVHRAIGSVQISRQVANLEIREAVTPASLLPLAVGIGVALGLAAGLGAGGQWPVFALAWQGVTYGVTDPYLHRDLGDFVAQLPLWEGLHDFARLLTWSALAVVGVTYAVIGALRWNGGRPALTDHARRHLGILLACIALVLAWGFLLDPFTAAAYTTPAMSVWGTVAVRVACAGRGRAGRGRDFGAVGVPRLSPAARRGVDGAALRRADDAPHHSRPRGLRHAGGRRAAPGDGPDRVRALRPPGGGRAARAFRAAGDALPLDLGHDWPARHPGLPVAGGRGAGPAPRRLAAGPGLAGRPGRSRRPGVDPGDC